MKVILLVDVKNLGKKYEVKEVLGGHARNFLLPRGLVKVATPKTLAELGKLKAKLDEEEKKLTERLESIAQLMESRTLKFQLRVDEAGKAFGSVNKDDILKSLRSEKFVTVERVEVNLAHPLKDLGEHKVEVDLKKGVKAVLRVMIERSPE